LKNQTLEAKLCRQGKTPALNQFKKEETMSKVLRGTTFAVLFLLFLLSIVAPLPAEEAPFNGLDAYIDQTSFLLADNGESNRKCVFFIYVDKVSAIRMDECKSYDYIIDSGYGGYQTMGSMNDGRLAVPTLGLLFNLYMDPKERSPILIRKL